MTTVWASWLSRVGAQVVVLVGEIEKWKPEKFGEASLADCGEVRSRRVRPWSSKQVDKYTINYTERITCALGLTIRIGIAKSWITDESNHCQHHLNRCMEFQEPIKFGGRLALLTPPFSTRALQAWRFLHSFDCWPLRLEQCKLGLRYTAGGSLRISCLWRSS